MIRLNVGRHWAIASALFLLVGCGGSQSEAITPQGSAPVPQRSARGAMGSGTDLLYVVTSMQTDILTYPGYKQVRSIKGFLGNATSNPNNGNVLFDNFYNAVEYARGGAKPIADFIPPENGEAYFDAAFDPTTNNIAVTVVGGNQSGDSVAVYQSSSQSPAFFYDTNMPYLDYLCYDNQGNLFVTGSAMNGDANMIAELPHASGTFTNININQSLSDMKALRWDGTYITVASGSSIYRLQFSGSSGIVVGKTTPKGFWARDGRYWIQGDTLIATHTSPETGTYLGFWKYPTGGRAFKTIKTLSLNHKDRLMDVTVSINPSR